MRAAGFPIPARSAPGSRVSRPRRPLPPPGLQTSGPPLLCAPRAPFLSGAGGGWWGLPGADRHSRRWPASAAVIFGPQCRKTAVPLEIKPSKILFIGAIFPLTMFLF